MRDRLSNIPPEANSGELREQFEARRGSLLDEEDPQKFKHNFRSMAEKGDLDDLGEYGDFSRIMAASELAKDTKIVQQMIQIYRDNYKSYPPEFVEHLVEVFNKALQKSGSLIEYFQIDGKVLAFLRFDFVPDKENLEYIYFGSFNVHRDYQKGKIGEVLLDDAIDLGVAAHGKPIVADCDPKAPITQTYFKRGFVATKMYDFRGVPTFRVVLDGGDHLTSKKWSRDKITQASEEDQSGEGIKVLSFAEDEDVNFDLLDQGYVLTNYFSEKKKTFCVFEKSKDKKPDIKLAA